MPSRKVGSETPTRLTVMNRRDSAGVAVDAGVDAHRHADDESQDRRGNRQFQRGRQPLGDQAGDRLRDAVADAEIAVQRGPEEAAVLHEEGLVKAKLVHSAMRCASVWSCPSRMLTGSPT